MLPEHNDFSAVSLAQITRSYLKAIELIDERVTLYLGKATTRALVQGAAKRIQTTYPFLAPLTYRPYTDLNPSVLHEYLGGVSEQTLIEGLNALLQECFAGLRELTGDIIVPPLHDEVIQQLQEGL